MRTRHRRYGAEGRAGADLPPRFSRIAPHLAAPVAAFFGTLPLNRARPARLSRLVEAAGRRRLYHGTAARRHFRARRSAGGRRVPTAQKSILWGTRVSIGV